MVPTTATAVATRGGAAPWHALLAQIDRTVGAAEQADTVGALTALGARRPASARRYLARERQRLVGELRRLGLHEPPWLMEPPAVGGGQPGGRGRLASEFSLLAQSYEDCAHLGEVLGLPELAHWLAERARIHREHAALLAW